MKNYIQRGEYLTLTPAAAVAGGSGYLSGSLFGVAVCDVAANQPGEFLTEGVVEIAKAPATAVTVGARLFWVPASARVNTTATGQQCVGVAVEAAGADAPTVKMKLAVVTPSGS